MGAGHGIGIKRNDYHRRNRKRNISMHKHSHGRNVGMGEFERSANQPIEIPRLTHDALIRLAKRATKTDHKNTSTSTLERICVNYLRHRTWPIGGKLDRSLYLLLSQRVFDGIAEAYPWLANECHAQYAERSNGNFRAASGVRVIKRSMTGELTSLHVQELNEREDAKPEIPITEDEEIPCFFNALSSLDQERFLYLPPFLKPDQIRERRFGDNPSDRWWEWEQELGLSSNEGRPDPKNAQY